MSSPKPFVAQWGILGCGWISSEFTMDVVRPTSTRNVTDISHAIAAVGSRTLEKAEQFIEKYCPKGGIGQIEGLVEFKPKAWGSYQQVVDDPNVNIVYVGTMNTCHYDDAKMALEGGKHCLLEKPATLNAAEWKSLSELAKKKGVFLMEAVWTRFNPTLLAIQKEVFEGTIGDIRYLSSDFSSDSLGKQPDTHRAWAAELAGGPLLDLGPYPMVWCMMMLYRHPKNDMTPPAKVSSSMLMYHTGVDLATTFSMTFPKIGALANGTSTQFSGSDADRHTRIVGSKGEIIVQGMACRPSKYIIRRFAEKEDEESTEELIDMSFDGFGLYWEADAVARCLKDGLTECPTMLHKETQLTMEIFDQIRKDGGYKYLPGLERVSL